MLWLKVLHVVAVISWMAGLLYLPRLFVNHTGRDPAGEAAQMLVGMERRLLKFIMRPAAAVTLLSGAGLAAAGLVDWSMRWMWLKLVGVAVLALVHGGCEHWQRQFAAGANRLSARAFRVINEVPTLAMVLVVAMVILKPA